MGRDGPIELPPQIAPPVVRIDPEALDPAARLLDAELTRADVAEHEAHHMSIELRDL